MRGLLGGVTSATAKVSQAWKSGVNGWLLLRECLVFKLVISLGWDDYCVLILCGVTESAQPISTTKISNNTTILATSIDTKILYVVKLFLL